MCYYCTQRLEHRISAIQIKYIIIINILLFETPRSELDWEFFNHKTQEVLFLFVLNYFSGATSFDNL